MQKEMMMNFYMIKENEIAKRKNIMEEMQLFAETGNEFCLHSFYVVMYDKCLYIGKISMTYLK